MNSGEKKILFSMLLIVVIFLSIISFVSSNSGGWALIPGTDTIVDGKVYKDGILAGGAAVTVSCEDPNKLREILTKTTTCDENGAYFVIFNYAEECYEDDMVTVIASKDGLTNSNSKKVTSYSAEPIDVFLMSNIVPEFGTLIGILTALSAIGVFFVVRRTK